MLVHTESQTGFLDVSLRRGVEVWCKSELSTSERANGLQPAQQPASTVCLST